MPKKQKKQNKVQCDPPIALSIINEVDPSPSKLGILKPSIEAIEEEYTPTGSDDEDGKVKNNNSEIANSDNSRKFVRSHSKNGTNSKENVYKSKSSQSLNGNLEGNGNSVTEGGYVNQAFQHHSSSLRDSSRSLP